MKKLLLVLIFVLCFYVSAFAYNITVYTNHETLHYDNVLSYGYEGGWSCSYFRIQLGFEANNRVILIDKWDIIKIEIDIR